MKRIPIEKRFSKYFEIYKEIWKPLICYRDLGKKIEEKYSRNITLPASNTYFYDRLANFSSDDNGFLTSTTIFLLLISMR